MFKVFIAQSLVMRDCFIASLIFEQLKYLIEVSSPVDMLLTHVSTCLGKMFCFKMFCLSTMAAINSMLQIT